MYNNLLTIGPVTVHGYGLMIAVGIMAAYLFGEYRAKRLGLDENMVFSLLFWCVIGGFAGSKLLFFLTEWKHLMEGTIDISTLMYGFVVYGGIIGGIFSGWLCTKVKKKAFYPYFDLVMPLVALAQGFGRIGCFLAGCCYGKETDSEFSIVFTNSSFAPNGVHLVPTQLISSGLDFLHFGFLLWISKKVKAEGQVGAVYLICYSVGRFFLEFFRGDTARGYVGLLSTSQFIAIFLFLAGVALYVWLAKKGKKVAAA